MQRQGDRTLLSGMRRSPLSILGFSSTLSEEFRNQESEFSMNSVRVGDSTAVASLR